MLKYKADPNIRNDKFITSLIIAVRNNDTRKWPNY